MKDPYMFTMDVKPVSHIHKTFILLLYEEVLNCPALRSPVSQTVHFPEPCYKPALLGKADDNNPALCPTLHSRKSKQGKRPNVIPPHLNGTAGTIKK